MSNSFLATTDPQKLPITVLSRCLQFHLKCLSPEQISQQLAYILQQENINYDQEALARLAYAAQGSMRDALSLLDQAISFSEEQVSTAAVKSMLSTIEATYIYQMVTALMNQDAAALMQISTELAEQSIDCANALEELLTLLHQIALCQYVPNANVDSWDSDKIIQFAQAISPEDIQLFYQIALMGRKDLPLTPTPKMGLEMTLLRMLAFQPDTTLKVLTPTTTTKATLPKASPQKTAQASEWQEIVVAMNLSGMTAAIANNCVLEKVTEDEVVLVIDPSQSVLLNKKHEQRLAESLQQYFKRPISLQIRKGKADMVTPAAIEQEDKAIRKKEAQEAITQDQNVQKIIETFDATLLPNSIEDL